MNGPAILFVFDSSEVQQDFLPESAILIPTSGYEAEVGQHIQGMLSKVYENLRGDCDILHALPEDSIICTDEDEIFRADFSLKGIFTYEEIKQTQTEDTGFNRSPIQFLLKQIDVMTPLLPSQ